MRSSEIIASRKSLAKKESRTDAPQKPRKIDAMTDLINSLADLPAFSFAFLGYDNTCATGPTVASAVDLVWNALNDCRYEGPYPASEFASQQAQALDELPEIVAAVKKHLRRMREEGVDFILCWQAYGEKQAHLDWHGDYSPDHIIEDLSRLLQQEVALILM
jgi:hypothetical protein